MQWSGACREGRKNEPILAVSYSPALHSSSLPPSLPPSPPPSPSPSLPLPLSPPPPPPRSIVVSTDCVQEERGKRERGDYMGNKLSSFSSSESLAAPNVGSFCEQTRAEETEKGKKNKRTNERSDGSTCAALKQTVMMEETILTYSTTVRLLRHTKSQPSAERLPKSR